MLKICKKLQEKRFVFVKILAIIIPENREKVSKIKCLRLNQQTLVKASVLLSNMSDFQSVYFEFQRVWTCSLLDMICFREQAVTLTSIKSVPDNTYKYINLQSSFPVAVSKI